MLDIYVGFDGDVEPVAYHVFCQSVLDNATIPVKFVPLSLKLLSQIGYEQEGNRDGSNAFIYSRFLVPFLEGFQNKPALFCDGDMIVKGDVAELLAMWNPAEAVKVVKHNYVTNHPTKYLGQKNDNYNRKNWSSVILWSCGHLQHRRQGFILDPKTVAEKPGSFLHRFEWLENRFIGELPKEWNHLETEYTPNTGAKLIHYTLGSPCFKGYQDTPTSSEWWKHYRNAIYPLTGKDKESLL